MAWSWQLARSETKMVLTRAPSIEVGREPRHAPRSGAHSKPTIEVAAIKVRPPTGRRSGRPAFRRSA